jgi:hypothetical protein
MEFILIVVLIALLIIAGALHSLTWSDTSLPDKITDNSMPVPDKKTSFTVRFSEDKYSPALRIPPDGDPQHIIDTFGLSTPRPVIFITGGASKMSDEDIQRTRDLVENGIARFAQEHRITVVDGGTEAGVMEMIGDARQKNDFNFPLVGVSPEGLVEYPGRPATHKDAAMLDAGHSHFVLVESDEWGGESEMIVNLTRAIADRQQPMMGILINGGRIAEHDVYLATAKGDNRIPMLIVDGSGRTADTVASAFKTRRTDSAIIKAIIRGGDIRLAALSEGVPALRKQLRQHFERAT